MGRRHCHGVSEGGLNKGPWTEEEDAILTAFVHKHGEGNWRSLPKRAGLKRCRKSCRLRWMNYLRPNVKRGNFSPDEDELIIKLHSLLGNRWALIAGRIPGRTDNDIKNYWNSRLKRKLQYISDAPTQFTQKNGLTVPPISYQFLDSSAPVKVEPHANSVLDSSEAETHRAISSANCQAQYCALDSFRLIIPERATSSEPSGKECTDHHSVELYAGPWIPEFRIIDETISGLELNESHPYAPESFLFLRGQAGDDQAYIGSDHLVSFRNGFTDFDFGDTQETSFQKLLRCVQKKLTTSSWPDSYNKFSDGYWSHVQA